MQLSEHSDIDLERWQLQRQWCFNSSTFEHRWLMTLGQLVCLHLRNECQYSRARVIHHPNRQLYLSHCDSSSSVVLPGIGAIKVNDLSPAAPGLLSLITPFASASIAVLTFVSKSKCGRSRRFIYSTVPSVKCTCNKYDGAVQSCGYSQA